MTQTVALPRKTLSTRLGTNPKTLRRKAMEKAAAAPQPEGEALEDMFPVSPADADGAPVPDSAAPSAADESAILADGQAASTDQAVSAATIAITESMVAPEQADQPPVSSQSIPIKDGQAAPAPAQSVVPAFWSEADEKAYKAMTTRRKAAGFQRRGRDVSAQQIGVGAIKPNPGTVVAAIVALVAARGTVSRGELLDLMATPAFEHPKGKGSDRAWSQGWAQGAIRDGFLVTADALGERSPNAPSASA